MVIALLGGRRGKMEVKFSKWLVIRETMRPIMYKPGAMIPTVTFRNSGPAKMNPLQSVPPSKPYMPIFRKGQTKTTVANRK